MKNRPVSRNRIAVTAIAGVTTIVMAMLLVAPSFAAESNVRLTASNQFVESALTISQGDTVTFTWEGGFHDVVFSDGEKSGDPVGVDGTTYSRTFDEVGTFDFVCSVHQSVGMVGTITVEAGASVPTTPPTTPPTTLPAATGGGGATAAATESAAPTGGSTSTSAPTDVPFTGPEDSMLPLVGLGLLLGGIGLRVASRASD